MELNVVYLHGKLSAFYIRIPDLMKVPSRI
jgi:hypothetical protein